MTPTYSVSLWDHDVQEFSSDFAAECLGSSSERLTLAELGRALRRLRKDWDRVSIYVYREDGK